MHFVEFFRISGRRRDLFSVFPRCSFLFTVAILGFPAVFACGVPYLLLFSFACQRLGGIVDWRVPLWCLVVVPGGLISADCSLAPCHDAVPRLLLLGCFLFLLRDVPYSFLVLGLGALSAFFPVFPFPPLCVAVPV